MQFTTQVFLIHLSVVLVLCRAVAEIAEVETTAKIERGGKRVQYVAS